MPFQQNIIQQLTQEVHEMTTQLKQTEKILRVLKGDPGSVWTHGSPPVKQVRMQSTRRISGETTTPHTRTLSVAARRRISLAAKARWAKQKKGIGLVRKAA